jgi:hypothetical protein
VLGRNTGDRRPDPALMVKQRDFLRNIATDPGCQPQSADSMMQFLRGQNPGLGSIDFGVITPGNFPHMEQSLRALYGKAFSEYPYDPVDAIGGSCGQNVFVTAEADGKLLAVTGMEILTLPECEVTIGEIGDSAADPDIKGLGPITKRYLLKVIGNSGKKVDLLFTDSRIGPVVKANSRAGFAVDAGIILPWHTAISSMRTPLETLTVTGEHGHKFPTENMTMTYLQSNKIMDILDMYGSPDHI